MIQPLPSPAAGLRGARALLCLAVLWIAGCASQQAQRKPADTAEAARARASFVPPFAYEAYVRGELALAQNKPGEAARQLELASAAPEEDAYLLSRLAEAQRLSGEATLAAQTLAEAERVDPCAESVWLTRGAWAELERDAANAARAYAQAVACAPQSERGVLALSRLWVAHGQQARALELLAQRAGAPSLLGAKAAFARALSAADVAEVRFALDSWLAQGALDAAMYRSALTRALEHSEPALALALAELPAAQLDAYERAQLLAATQARTALRALLAQRHESELGGPDEAARFALLAKDFERAELYASVSLARRASDHGHATRALARRALGQQEAALDDTRAVSNPEQRRALARAQLATLGLGALAAELERLPAQQ